MQIARQVAFLLVLFAAAIFGWARFDPAAGERMVALGVPANLAERIAGPKTEVARRSGSQAPGAFDPANREILVVTAPVATARINDRVSAIGDGKALRSVTVVPLTAGIITKVLLKSGDRVQAGDVLAELDAETETIARDRAALTVEMANEKLKRYEQLVASRTVSAVQVTEARNEYDNAALALRDAELTLKRRLITAPIDGVIGLVPVEPGHYVTTQSEIATIDDRSEILVDFWVPERFAAAIEIGQELEAVAVAMPGDVFSGVIAEIASRVDRDSRTLQVRARLDNPADKLRAGMSFRVLVRFPGEEFPAVNPLAIQWSSEGAFVWKESEGKAVRTPVRIVQRNSDSVLVDGNLTSGEELVVEGVQTLREGARVRVAGERTGPRPAGS